MDRRFAKYVLEGMEHGFRVGFDHSYPLVLASHNTPSASKHTEVIDAYIVEEVASGRILGPFQPGSMEGLHVNRMGVIPKGHTLGRWRLITDLLFQAEASAALHLSRESSHGGNETGQGVRPCWRSWTSSPHTAYCQYIQTTGCCWACTRGLRLP